MRVTLESTDKTVELRIHGMLVPARIWEGQTAGGVCCHAYVTRICFAVGDDATEFERELLEMRPASAEIAALPARLVL